MARACCKSLQQALLYVSQAADLPQENVVTYADTPSTCHCEPVPGAPQRGTLCGERSPKGALLPRWPLAGGEYGVLATVLAYLSFACHCEPVTGTPQRGTLCGERRPKGALPGSGLWPELGMADFGATTWRTLGRRHGGLWGDEAWQSASPAQGVHCGNVLTNVATPPPSACHCKTRPCNRSNASVFCMSLRTSAHTGAAIRNPAGKPSKLAIPRANPQLLRIRRE